MMLGSNNQSINQSNFPHQAAVELKVAGLEAELADYKKKYEEEAHIHAQTREALPKLERMIAERDGQIDYMTKSITALEAELARFKNEVRM